MRLLDLTSSTLLAGAGILAAGIATPAAAQESSRAATRASTDVTVAAMPLNRALEAIAAQTGRRVAYDPDAVASLNSAPVVHARSALAAVRAAVRGTNLAVTVEANGSIQVANDILVVAHRDEAETSVLVNQTSTSNRSGQSLREQPRNTQVISSKPIADQQDLTLLDALRNAGGVVLNTATAQGGNTYSIRGFASDGLVNGLPTSSATGIPAGATEPVAAIERVEVLKGPDAILSGANSLGGAVNIVFKKPFAEPALTAQVDTGSYGLRRFTVDANAPLTADGHLSVRLIGSESNTDENFGGYAGGKDNLLLPEVRFKNAATDITVGFAASETRSGLVPYGILDTSTKKLFAVPRDQPPFSADQSIGTTNEQVFVNATQKVTNWLEGVVRFQHQHTTLSINIYTVLTVLDPSGLALLDNARGYQTGYSDAVDAYLRARFRTFGAKHTLVGGYSYVSGDTTSYSASGEDIFPYQFVGNRTPPEALAAANTLWPRRPP